MPEPMRKCPSIEALKKKARAVVIWQDDVDEEGINVHVLSRRSANFPMEDANLLVAKYVHNILPRLEVPDSVKKEMAKVR